eukprot:GHVT01034146.1.p1 GENE.GHVT01034146.1~~GHVT01034146.1.p1  ORF type:complete len:270 (-),score=26.78 GHVT01034146.1:711-1520(-)
MRSTPTPLPASSALGSPTAGVAAGGELRPNSGGAAPRETHQLEHGKTKKWPKHIGQTHTSKLYQGGKVLILVLGVLLQLLVLLHLVLLLLFLRFLLFLLFFVPLVDLLRLLLLAPVGVGALWRKRHGYEWAPCLVAASEYSGYAGTAKNCGGSPAGPPVLQWAEHFRCCAHRSFRLCGWPWFRCCHHAQGVEKLRRLVQSQGDGGSGRKSLQPTLQRRRETFNQRARHWHGGEAHAHRQAAKNDGRMEPSQRQRRKPTNTRPNELEASK